MSYVLLFLFFYTIFLVVFSFNHKFLVIIFLEASFMICLVCYLNLFSTEDFFMYFIFTVLIFMVLDSCSGLSILSSVLRNSSFYSSDYYKF